MIFCLLHSLARILLQRKISHTVCLEVWKRFGINVGFIPFKVYFFDAQIVLPLASGTLSTCPGVLLTHL